MTRTENWNLILQLCAEAKDDVVDCLRIELLNDFGKVDAYSGGPNLRHLAACFRSFLPSKTRADLPAVIRHKPVIFFPATSSSNLQNLLPVAIEAKRRDLLGGIVTGAAVKSGSDGVFSEFSPVLREQDLNGRIGMGFLPRSLQRAVQRLNWVISWLKPRHAHHAKRIRQNYGAYVKMMITAERARIACRELLLAWQPSCLLSTSDFYPFEFQLIWQARKLGIPTAILQHGESNDVVVWPTYADTFLAWGESYREQFLKRGAPENRLRVTGMPASDELFRKSECKASTDDKTAGPVCLVLSHTQDRVEDSVLFEAFGRCLIDTIRSTPGMTWNIKLHPSEDDSFYRENGMANLAQVKVLPRETSLEQAVNQSDVVCTIRSTAGLQAMMMRKPVIVLDLAKQGSAPVTWPLQGGGIYAKEAEQFRSNLNRLISDAAFLGSVLSQQHQFLEFQFANRGQAATAVVDFLENQTQAGKH